MARWSWLLGSVGILLGSHGCSSREIPDEQHSDSENVKSVDSALVTANANVLVQSTYAKRHETSVAHTEGNGNGVRWLVAWNGQSDPNGFGVGWVSSNDPLGSSWSTPHETNAANNFFAGPSAYWSSRGRTIWPADYRGDVSVTGVTDPTINNHGRRALVATLLDTVDPTLGRLATNDVIVAMTDDLVHIQHASYLNDGTTGGGADVPKIASNPVSPFDTFGTWENSQGHWLLRFFFDAAGTFHKDASGAHLIPPPPTGFGQRHDMAFVHLPAGCTGGGEGVVLVLVDAQNHRCDDFGFDGQRHPQDWNSYIVVWDQVALQWHGPWLLQTATQNPVCVGNPAHATNSNDLHTSPVIRTEPASG